MTKANVTIILIYCFYTIVNMLSLLMVFSETAELQFQLNNRNPSNALKTNKVLKISSISEFYPVTILTFGSNPYKQNNNLGVRITG
jgi:hypothetical protein